MKKLSLLCVLLVIIISISACSHGSTSGNSNDSIDNHLKQYQSTIASLENQITLLKQNQTLSDSEYEKKLEELTAKLDAIKAEVSTSDAATGDSDNISEISVGFKYIVSGNTATITGYAGDDTQIVIPSSVDGYKITAIADGAFEDTSVKSIIISEGIETVGWFAFNGCTRLSSITIPSSVTSIGYSAFAATDSSLTIYCHSDSFALAYAKSYGLSYTVI